MTKEFIPYEQALALKELGFNEPCFAYYNGYKELDHLMPERVVVGRNYNGDTITSAPLFQQAFRWFREKYKMQAEILWRGDMGCFCYKTGKFKYREHTFSEKDYKTYEEAELACLIKLIQIANEKTI